MRPSYKRMPQTPPYLTEERTTMILSDQKNDLETIEPIRHALEGSSSKKGKEVFTDKTNELAVSFARKVTVSVFKSTVIIKAAKSLPVEG